MSATIDPRTLTEPNAQAEPRSCRRTYVAYVEPPCCGRRARPVRVAGPLDDHVLLLERCQRCGSRWVLDYNAPTARIRWTRTSFLRRWTRGLVG